jgi:hypothetical protein
MFAPVTEFDWDSRSECKRIFGKDYDEMVHYPASLMRQEFARVGWDFDKYTSISSVRNPWARTVSLYTNVKRVGFDWTFDDFVLNHLRDWQSGLQRRWNSYEMFHERGQQIVDHIVRIEYLEHDLRPFIEQRWPDLKLDYSMRSNPGKHSPFREFYTDTTSEVVADFFAYDIETFGYRFEDASAG